MSLYLDDKESNIKFISYKEFSASDLFCDEYEEHPEKCFQLIEENIVTVKTAFEFYIEQSFRH
jgi:hypothetical protein